MRRRHGASGFASFIPTQFSFSRPSSRCLNIKCICTHLCAHGGCCSKKRVPDFEELKIYCATDQLNPESKPGLHFSCYTQGHAAAHKHAKYKRMKRLQGKIIVFYRLNKYKNVIHVIMDSHCVSQNAILFARAWADSFDFLETRSVCANNE